MILRVLAFILFFGIVLAVSYVVSRATNKKWAGPLVWIVAILLAIGIGIALAVYGV